MAVTGDDTARVQGRPKVVSDGLVAQVVANGLLHLGKPVQHLLVSQTVQRTSQSVHASSKRKEGRAEGRADKVGGVGADVATLVVGVDGQVETEQLNEVGVVAETELVGEVERVVLVLLDRGDLATLEDVLVDAGSDGGQLSNQVHRVLKGVSPVLLLVNTLGIGLGEGRGLLEGSDGHRELSHGVQVVGAAVDELLDELGKVGTGSPLGGQGANLGLRGNLTGQEEPEKTCRLLVSLGYSCALSCNCQLTLRKRLLATGSLGEELLAFWDSLATETDTLLRVEDGSLPDEALDATGTTVDLVKSDLVNDLGTVLPAVITIILVSSWYSSFIRSSGRCFDRITYLRRDLISSIFSGRSSAKRSFRV